MNLKNAILIFLVSVLFNEIVFAQKSTVKTDTSAVYRDIETYSKRSKFKSLLYQLVFKPVAKIASIKKTHKRRRKTVYKKLIKMSYKAYEGKIIRNINIETLDPFGYSVSDTAVSEQTFIIKSANKLHVKSQKIAIRNLMLIRPDQEFDSLLVKESERLVRSQGYVHDVSFMIQRVSRKSDSVDIFIRELDNWSITADVSASSSGMVFYLTDKNFLGTGHTSRNGFIWYQTRGNTAYNANYYIPNIRNTYINTTLNYTTDEYRNFTRSFSIDRPFYSAFTKWAGGAFFLQQFRHDSIITRDIKYLPLRYKFNIQDYWAGNAFRVFKGNSEYDRTTNFISALRFLRIRYHEKPSEISDPHHFYSNEDFYLSSIGISTRKYVQDKYIFGYGVTEDIPIGKVYSLTGGYQVKDNTGRMYMGIRVSSGFYHPWGYLSSNLEYGTFFLNSHAEQGVISAGLTYFTGLIEVGKWKFRQFIKPQVTLGVNRLDYDSLTLNSGFGLGGFNSAVLSGSGRLLLTLQTQSYAPWNVLGFRFGPCLFYSLGLLGDPATGFHLSRVYSQMGFGILIKNENLVLSIFQLSVAFYPYIPGKGPNLFKFNSFQTTDFNLRDFEIGKPVAVLFQ